MWLTVNGAEDAERLDQDDGLRRAPSWSPISASSCRLLPGDIISTGTPPGVGMGMKPPRFLKAGDVVELGIEGSASKQRAASKADASETGRGHRTA